MEIKAKRDRKAKVKGERRGRVGEFETREGKCGFFYSNGADREREKERKEEKYTTTHLA